MRPVGRRKQAAGPHHLGESALSLNSMEESVDRSLERPWNRLRQSVQSSKYKVACFSLTVLLLVAVMGVVLYRYLHQPIPQEAKNKTAASASLRGSALEDLPLSSPAPGLARAVY